MVMETETLEVVSRPARPQTDRRNPSASPRCDPPTVVLADLIFGRPMSEKLANKVCNLRSHSSTEGIPPTNVLIAHGPSIFGNICPLRGGGRVRLFRLPLQPRGPMATLPSRPPPLSLRSQNLNIWPGPQVRDSHPPRRPPRLPNPIRFRPSEAFGVHNPL